jgi:hypothetical protein
MVVQARSQRTHGYDANLCWDYCAPCCKGKEWKSMQPAPARETLVLTLYSELSMITLTKTEFRTDHENMQRGRTRAIFTVPLS